MRTSLKTSFAAALAALTIGIAAASPAQANGGFHPHGGWHSGHGGWHGGGWGGPALALGLFGAAVATGIAADECLESRAVYDHWGNYLGRRTVNVCY